MRLLIIICLVLFIIGEYYFRFWANYNESYFDIQHKIIKRKKNTRGIYKTKHTNTGYFRINNEGWNSHREYSAKEPDKTVKHNSKTLRIAIVGHSNIEGLRVPVNKTISKVFEDNLVQNGVNAEVYTFGYGGMHLAQALHVSRYVIDKYNPDMLIVGTLTTNFLTDYSTNSNFMSLQLNSGDDISEILPKKYKEEEKSVFSFLYFSKAIKYLDLKCGLGYGIYNLINKKVSDNIAYSADKSLVGVDYIIKEFIKATTASVNKNIPILFINFPQQVPSFNYNYIPNGTKLSSERKAVISALKQHNLSVIHLEEHFIGDYKISNTKFDFPGDGHYNAHAHQVMGNALYKYFSNSDLIND